MNIQLNSKIEIPRLNALRNYHILDTPPDGSFDQITALTSKIFNVPIAIISLVDENRIWFKSHFGIKTQQIKREPGLCSSAILSNDIYLVEDAKNDPRTLTNALVASEFGLQFYAAAPLTTHDGFNLGTLCILDKRQRYINTDQQVMLREMANLVMNEMDLRLEIRNEVALYKKRIADLERQLEPQVH